MSATNASALFRPLLVSLVGLVSALSLFGAPGTSRVEERELTSKNIAQNKIGVNPSRKIFVYLPSGYDDAPRRYPVIYFFPNPLEGDLRFIFDHRDAQAVFDRATASGVIRKFILVCPDMATPFGSSWYTNSSTTGNWEDFVVQELVPYIDANFKTIPNRDSRGITGIFMGAYGAFRIGMKHPDVFGAVYAMHPVGTGSGVRIMDSLPKLDLMEQAKTLDDVKQDGVTVIFTSIFEAFLPNPEKPPLYIDLPAHRENGQLVIDSKLTDRLRNGFFLESLIGRYADNLKSLRGLKIDWSRADSNYDHVYSLLALTHKLNEYGIVHEAEEYNGAWGESYWGADGRITTDVLPFFARHLIF